MLQQTKSISAASCLAPQSILPQVPFQLCCRRMFYPLLSAERGGTDGFQTPIHQIVGDSVRSYVTRALADIRQPLDASTRISYFPSRRLFEQELGVTMKNGFLGFRTSFMLDFVVVALVLILPVLVYSLTAVKRKKRYGLHRRLQLLLSIVLLLAVGLFEIDLQWVQGGWLNVVGKREVKLTNEQLNFVRQVLSIHLWFAISTPVLWMATIGLALVHFPSPPQPSEHSAVHKILGWLCSIDIVLTSVTGLLFYFFAFVSP